MRSLLTPEGLARTSARHAWLVVTVWIVVLIIAGVLAATALGGVLSSDTRMLNQPESVRADDLLAQSFPSDTGGSEIILIHSDRWTVDQPAFAAKLHEISSALLKVPGLVASAPFYQEAKAAGSPLAEQMVARDRHTTLIPVTFVPDDKQQPDSYATYAKVLDAQRGGDFGVYPLSSDRVDHQFTVTAKSDLQREIYGLPVALVVLILVFGALVAAGIPIALGIVSIIVALGLAAIAGQFSTLSTYAENMITVIGLAVGIDYALFIVERFREERRQGASKRDAIAAAGGSASKAVLFSGMTVVIALLGLLLIPTTLFRSLGAGAIFVVFAAVLAMLTLVPALLQLIGDHLEWPRHRKPATVTSAAPTKGRGQTGYWSRMAGIVTRRPAISAVLAVILLLALASPFASLKTGSESVSTLPPSDVKTAAVLLDTNFPAGLIDPVSIVVDGKRTPAIDAAIQRLTADLGKDPTYGPVLSETWNPAGDVAEVQVPLAIDVNSPAAYAAIQHLRHDQIPAAFAGSATVLVTGTTAKNQDLNQLIEDWTPIVFGFVLGMSFLLLLLAFRSLVVPVTAILMNLLSVGAAYGLMVLVFQKGYLHGLFGFQRTPTIVNWIPIFLFCVLFGLSMDYHVFLLSRIREHYDQTRRNAESVAVGLQATGKIITGAALIMVVVFAAFATGQLVMFQQVGFGLAVAIFLDATVVRCVLVPATMTLLGDANWYLPHWLSWLPDLRVEGNLRPQATAIGIADQSAASSHD